MRYQVTPYEARAEHGAKMRFAVEDTRHRRPVNLSWSDRKEAQEYADRLNLRATGRTVPMGVWA